MKILKPFSITPQKKPADMEYFRHRQAMRFLNVLGMGIQRVADDHAQKIIDSQKEIGHKPRHYLERRDLKVCRNIKLRYIMP